MKRINDNGMLILETRLGFSFNSEYYCFTGVLNSVRFLIGVQTLID